MSITQTELALQIMRRRGRLIPAKLVGSTYGKHFIGSEFSRRCRQLRAEGMFFSPPEREDNFAVFLPTKKLLQIWKKK